MSFQYKLHKNFGYSDNFVIKTLETSLSDLRSKKMDLPPLPPDNNEFPKNELGTFIEQTMEKKLGLRSSCFTDTEKNVTDLMIARSEENGNDLDVIDENQSDNISNLNTGMLQILIFIFPLYNLYICLMNSYFIWFNQNYYCFLCIHA